MRTPPTKIWRYEGPVSGARPYRIALIGDSIAYGMWARYPMGARLGPRLVWDIWRQAWRFIRVKRKGKGASLGEVRKLRDRWMDGLKDFCAPELTGFFTEAWWGMPHRLAQLTGRPVEIVDLCAIGISHIGARKIVETLGDPGEAGPFDVLVVCAANNHVVHADDADDAVQRLDELLASCARRLPGTPVVIVGMAENLVEVMTRELTLTTAVRMPPGFRDVSLDRMMNLFGYRLRNKLVRGASAEAREPMQRLVRALSAALDERDRTTATVFHAPAAGRYPIPASSGLSMSAVAVDGFHPSVVGHQIIADALMHTLQRVEAWRADAAAVPRLQLVAGEPRRLEPSCDAVPTANAL